MDSTSAFLRSIYRYVIILLAIFLQIINCRENRGWDECTTMIYTQNRVDVSAMLYNCSANIPSPLMIPSVFAYQNGYYPTNVSLNICLNNLIDVDSIGSTVTLDFWYRNYWIDPRFNLPDEAWENINPHASTDGLDLTQLVRSTNNALNMWLPDIVYFEGIDINILAENIRLFPSGLLFWSRHVTATLAESTMNLNNFPYDTQNFSMTFQSYAYDSEYLLIALDVTDAVTFNEDEELDMNYIEVNQLWSYIDWSAYDLLVSRPIFYNHNRKYSTAFINLVFQRRGIGFVFRLVLPITIFMVIVGFTFWADLDKRIDATINMLLIVAALYLVIGQLIPFVGYLTAMDIFILIVFVCLAITIGIHFVTYILDAQQSKYPLNGFVRDFIVFIFRLFWIPFSFAMFLYFFYKYLPPSVAAAFLALTLTIAAFLVFYSAKKISTLKKSFKNSILELRKKVSDINEYNKQVNKLREENPEGVVEGQNLRLNKFEVLMLSLTENMYRGVSARQKAMESMKFNSADVNATIDLQYSSSRPTEIRPSEYINSPFHNYAMSLTADDAPFSRMSQMASMRMVQKRKSKKGPNLGDSDDEL